MIFEHLFSDNFCDNLLSHTHIIDYFISLLFWFPCKYLWVNRQLPPWNCKFRQLPPEINKTSITPWNCTTLINLPPPSNFSISEHDVLQIPPLKFCTYAQNAPQTWKFIFFFCVMRTIAILFYLFIWGK